MQFVKFKKYHDEQRDHYLNKIKLINLEDNIFSLITLHTILTSYFTESKLDIESVHFILIFNNYMLGENESPIRINKILINDSQDDILKNIIHHDNFYDIKKNVEKYFSTKFESLEKAAMNLWSKKNNPNIYKFIFSNDYSNDLDFAIREGFALKISFFESFINNDEFNLLPEILEKLNIHAFKIKINSML